MSHQKRQPQQCVAPPQPVHTRSVDLATNNEAASTWGNGLTAQGVTGPDGGGGGVGTSFRGIAQDLANPLWGYSPGRTWNDWLGGGAGAAYGGTVGGDNFSQDLGIGVGVGGGIGQYTDQSKGRTTQGYGGGAAVGGRIDSNTSAFGESFGFGGDVYRGVGGTAYRFEDPSKGQTGFGASGGYTPFGINDGYVRREGMGGSHEVGVGSAEFGRVGGQLEGYTTDDGGWGLNGGYTTGRTSVRDATLDSHNPLGHTTGSLGQASQGSYYQGSIGQDGDGRIHGQFKRGGSLTVNDAAINHDWGNGMNSYASLGRYGGNGSEYNAGFNPNTGALDFHGSHSTGKRWNDVAVGTDLPGGSGVHASMGQFQHGSQIRIDEGSHIGPDGVHVSGGGHMNDGIEIRDVAARANLGEYASYEASMGRFSNRTTVDGASLDIDGSGVHAGVDRLRTGGMIMEDMRVQQEVLGINSSASLGEFSNDVLVNGARLDIDGSGVSAGFDELDFGGIRLNDAAYQTDLGELADVNASMGSFTNGNNIRGGDLTINENGIAASVEEFGVMGTDVRDVRVGVDGPGGSFANAELGSYHSGITGQNAFAEINGDGVQVGAERLGYAQHAIDDVALRGGVEGVYESYAELGHGHINQASAENVNVALGRDGLSASADNLAYSYLGVEDFRAGQSFGDGAVETELALGRGSYLGGSADHVSFQSDLLNTRASVDGLNAHGLQLEDLNAHVGVGEAGLNVGADELNVLDLNVGHASFERENLGLSGRGRLEDAQLDVLNAEGLGGGLTWGDQTVAEARTDLNLSAGVENAQAEWDVLNGTASGSFENANASLMTDNTRLEAFGHGIDIGRTGATINASGAGELDVFNGRAGGNVNFAGSELALFGHSLEVGDWAQASGNIDALAGQANFNVGGENGVGADIDIGAGNLDINAFGHTIDVDQGVRDAAGWVGDRASDVATGVSNAASWVGDRASDVASGVSNAASRAGSAISSGASRAWDAVTSW